MNGISTNRRSTEHLACLRAAGINFIARYYSTTTVQPEKRLTLSEAQAISAAGMTIVACYEDGPTQAAYFTNARGHLDGVNAYHTAIGMLQPRDTAIYFAVDYDAAPSDIAHPISDYFKGVQQGFADAAQGSQPLYSIGVYGSGSSCDWVKRQLQIATYSWLAESTGWDGSKTYTDWNIKQEIAAADLCSFTGGVGGSYEVNAAQGAIGDFKISAPDKIANAVHLMIANHATLAAAAAAPDPSAPVADALGWKATFKFKLQVSSQLVIGSLSLTNGSGVVVLDVPATSGLQGHQAKSNLWEVKRGPVPPNPKVNVGNAIETLERSTPAISREFRIQPESVTQPTPPHVTRGEFRVHHEHGTHGSEGCIALINEADFDQFADLMHTLHNHGTETIPLAIRYS